MLRHTWLTTLSALLLFWTNCLDVGTNGQSENAIGAHRVFEKTSFSCAGRPAGYYADVETGCQVYHMCDGLGRQFSYSCPNTTLFQQRMLICDHWYMVNCSKAESNYAANLLIGQRDKPFVNDEENSLRTPRPDLLDRPYAPDYSGESFRNQYKQISAPQNQIYDSNAQKNLEKPAHPSQLAVGQTRWKIPPPSRLILPPAYEPQIVTEAPGKKETQQSKTATKTRVTSTTRSYQTSAKTTRKPTISTTTKPTKRAKFSALHQRQLEPLNDEHDDLGTSHSTRYNTSADFNSDEVSSSKVAPAQSNRNSFQVTTKGPTTTASASVPIKVPSKIYEPPFLYPIYNEEDLTQPSIEKSIKLATSTATPFTKRISTTSTTSRPPSRPTTFAGKPFTSSSYVTPTAPASVGKSGRNQNILVQRFDSPKLQKENRTPAPAQGFKPPTPRPPAVKTLKRPQTADKTEAGPFEYKVPVTSRLNLPTPFIQSPQIVDNDLPSKDLLPPFQEFVQHDTATTQGPPIYYEWKVPSNGLEPPKLDPPIGVDGREYTDPIIDYNAISATGAFIAPSTSTSASFAIDQSPQTLNTASNVNPFLPLRPTQEASTTRTPISRSIKESAQPNSISPRSSAPKKSDTKTTTAAPSAPKSDITQLRKELSVPEYAFPLEKIGRTGYLATDTYNSFQLKIPEQRSDADAQKLHWFGENPKCPQCHPSYVVPGTCEPCLRR